MSTRRLIKCCTSSGALYVSTFKLKPSLRVPADMLLEKKNALTKRICVKLYILHWKWYCEILCVLYRSIINHISYCVQMELRVYRIAQKRLFEQEINFACLWVLKHGTLQELCFLFDHFLACCAFKKINLCFHTCTLRLMLYISFVKE
jgi:hypothetical protein